MRIIPLTTTDNYAGRIRLETEGPMKRKWQWAGSCPRPMCRRSINPNVGYCSGAALAAQAVEIYWDASKAKRAVRLANYCSGRRCPVAKLLQFGRRRPVSAS